MDFQIEYLMDGAFFGLSRIEELSLDRNKVPIISKAWLYGLKTLRFLSLSFNKVWLPSSPTRGGNVRGCCNVTFVRRASASLKSVAQVRHIEWTSATLNLCSTK